MIEALYGIEFVSNMSSFGYGVVVLETERIYGGDSSFVYIGHYKVENNTMSVDIKCTNDRKCLPSIFGDADNFHLHLKGTPAHNEFILQGYMVENPSMKIGVKLTRRAELP